MAQSDELFEDVSERVAPVGYFPVERALLLSPSAVDQSTVHFIAFEHFEEIKSKWSHNFAYYFSYGLFIIAIFKTEL